MKKNKKAAQDAGPSSSVLQKQFGYDDVAYISRIDIGSDGYRKGLLLLTEDRARVENVDCLYLVGGLVNKFGVAARIRKIQAEEKEEHGKAVTALMELVPKRLPLVAQLKELKAAKKDCQKLEQELKELDEKIQAAKEEVARLKPRTASLIMDMLVEEIAQELDEDLPHFKKSTGEKVKLYIVTSPAYDGQVGHRVADRLVELRRKDRDVLYFGQVRSFVKLKKSGQGVVLLTPEKAVWRTTAYSAYPDRLVVDDLKRGSKTPPDMYVVGCFGSSLNRGKGSKKFQRISLPVLHKLENTTTGENMVGMRIVRHHRNGATEVRTFDFKHLLTNERSMITLPPSCTKVQAKILEDLKVHGSRSIGQMEDELEIPRDVLDKALKNLLEKKNVKASILFNENSAQYSFNPKWLQKNLRFTWPEAGPQWMKDTIVGFSCMHAGSVHTAEEFILNDLPEIVVNEKANVLFSAGDNIEGMKHDLLLRKEVLAGFNYSKMEEYAAKLLSTVMLKAFDKRLTGALKDKDPKKMTQAEVKELIAELLVIFIYICGNHDEWELDIGLDPLAHFDLCMRMMLRDGIGKILMGHGLPSLSSQEISELVDKKVIRFTEDDHYTLPSGLTVGAIHYHAGRTATNSVWPERALAQFRVHHELVGNFHVEEHVEEYDAELGLRASDMLPTLKCKSDFESKKGKIVDFGVGVRKLISYKGRVLITEGGLHGKNPHKSAPPDEAYQAHLKRLGLDK
ncbi:hypothetical protein KGO95_02030 [Patescibacteria group bacterium]|nr:hypothetical protein [Patescibacteria group bacterium]